MCTFSCTIRLEVLSMAGVNLLELSVMFCRQSGHFPVTQLSTPGNFFWWQKKIQSNLAFFSRMMTQCTFWVFFFRHSFAMFPVGQTQSVGNAIRGTGTECRTPKCFSSAHRQTRPETSSSIYGLCDRCPPELWNQTTQHSKQQMFPWNVFQCISHSMRQENATNIACLSANIFVNFTEN